MQKTTTLFSISTPDQSLNSTEIRFLWIPVERLTFTLNNPEIILFTLLLRNFLLLKLTFVSTRINNLVIGSSWVDHPGTLQITNLRTKDTCSITFEECNWLGSNMHNVSGPIKNAAGKEW
jgi:hypothetical protein